MNERAFQDSVVTVAQLLGWFVYHARAARLKDGSWRTAGAFNSKGYPDLTLIRERALWVELKVGRNKPTLEQTDWLSRLRAAGCEAYLWTESDWADGTVEAVLRHDARSAAA